MSRFDIVDDLIVNGLARTAVALHDDEVLRRGPIVYYPMRRALAQRVRSDETATFALPAMLIDGEQTHSSLAVFLEHRLLVCWLRRGVLRGPHVTEIDYSVVGHAEMQPVSAKSPLAFLTIHTDATRVLLLPASSEFSAAVLSLLTDHDAQE